MKFKSALISYLFVCMSLNYAYARTQVASKLIDTGTFIGSTPGDKSIKSLLNIPADLEVDFIKWKLILNRNIAGKRSFSLVLLYGELQQNTLSFKGGGKKLSLTGEYNITSGTSANLKVKIYHLKPLGLAANISLYKVNDNLMHILTSKQTLMVGNAGWSFTLNRVPPVVIDPTELLPLVEFSSPLTNPEDTISIFQGRTLCNTELRQVNAFTASGCQRIKWVLTLHRDPKTFKPTAFQLRTIYVGENDGVYSKTGKWMELTGTKSEPKAIVYILKSDHDPKDTVLSFLKGDTNILFFLDKDKKLMVGNGNHSYTLNRKSK